MKSPRHLALAACVLLPAATLLGQATGVSHPDDLDDTITTRPAAKPSAAVPLDAAPAYPTAAAPAVLLEQRDSPAPIVSAPPASLRTSTILPAQTVTVTTTRTSVTSVPATQNSVAYDPDANIVTQRSIDAANAAEARQELADGDTPDPAVTFVKRGPASPFELPEGSQIAVTLKSRLSTSDTRVGAPFQAETTRDVVRNGIVLIPARSVVSGRVTALHGGARIHGAAYIRLQPQFVTLPDGTSFHLVAQIVDTDLGDAVHITSEGTIKHSDNVKGTLSAAGLATGSTAVAGALIAGPAGALVGAGVGVGVSTVVLLRQDQQQVLAPGTGLVLALTSPLDVRSSADQAFVQHRQSE